MSIRAMKWAMGVFETADIPHKTRMTLMALCWDHTESGCFPSQKRLALMTGLGTTAVKRNLETLEKIGLIARETKRSSGRFQQTSYALFGRLKSPIYGRDRGHTGGHGTVDQKRSTAPWTHGGLRHRGHTGGQYRGIYLIGGKPDPERDPIQEEKIAGEGGENV